LCVADRARGAIDDFLWSRWQLYLQVINHKANVVLESIFPDAFKSVTKQPTDLDDYAEILLFTDETVMSQVRRDFLATHKRTNPARTPAKLAFLRTRLPKHLHVEELDEVEDVESEKILIATRQSELAHAMGVSLTDIRVTKTTSDLIKTDGALPRVIRKVVGSSGAVEYQLCEPDYLSRRWQEAGRPTRVRRVHFFTTAELTAQEIIANPAPIVEALTNQVPIRSSGSSSTKVNKKK
jgi:HD superfamily phosphohydrolase